MSRSIRSPCCLFFFSLALQSIMPLPATSAVIRCHEAERQALLEFKQRLEDSSNRLSSWVGEDCCAWEGVGCSNITAHVIKLNLRNEHYYFDDDWDKFALRGDISADSSLQSLQHLTHLDLSRNDFRGHTIPVFLGSFPRLTYLNLSYACFSGRVPDELGNLSTLRHLDLSYNYYYSDNYYNDSVSQLYVENLGWIARLTSLQHLNMSSVSFRRTSNWFKALNALPYIQDVDLAWCDLPGSFPHSLPHLNFTSLRRLNLAGNYMNGTEPAWLYNLTSLESLNFRWNDIFWSSMHGSISRLTYLSELDLSGNNVSKSFLLSLSNLCKLQILILEGMPNKNELSNLEMVFSGCLMYGLEELQLGSNQLHDFPDWLRSMKNLKHIDLSYNLLHGSTPNSLGSLTSLQYLDLHFNNLNGTIGESIGQLKNLIHLDLSSNFLHGSIPNSLGSLTSVQYLALSYNNLNGTLGESFEQLKNIIHLDLSYNSLSLSLIHLANFSSLKYLDISNNTLLINDTSDWMPPFQLQSLHMDSCKMVPRPHFPKWLQTQSTLSSLSLTKVGIEGTIPNWLPSSLKYLRFLDLSNNHFNNLNGTVGENFGQLKNLISLDLSYNSLSLSLIHLANLSSLKYLDISNNTLLINDTTDWMPPFQLQSLHMDSCKMVPRPHFPKWLQTQSTLSSLSLVNVVIEGTIPNWLPSSLKFLDLSNNRIGGELRHFFPNLIELFLPDNSLSGHLPLQMANMMPSLEILDLSNNHFMGELSQNFSKLQILILSNNMFSGHLNPTIGNTLLNLEFLDLSMNNFSGNIPHSLCQMNSLFLLDVSKNNFSRELPNCWNSSIPTTKFDFSNNQFYGEIPNTLCNLSMIQSLHLSNNHLSGRIPLCLQDCKYLITLDAGHNYLVGNIPSWSNKSLSYLKVLNLRSNSLSGIIPELSMLTHLQILDLSNNNLLGSIPRTFGNFTIMRNSPKDNDIFPYRRNSDTLWLFIKGNEYEYVNFYTLVISIDLSNNNLSGYIPKELGYLYRLQSLNLSRNNLVGEIPRRISGIQNLEALDLSRNNLSGAIPSTLSDLTFLGILNLSYNNLSGSIPTGRHLQTFDASTYIGNPYLCGSPLTKNCTNDIAKGIVEEENKHGDGRRETIWLLSSITMGFIMGFWGIWGTLLLHKRWRIFYFRTIDNTYDKLCMEMLVKIRRKPFVED